MTAHGLRRKTGVLAALAALTISGSACGSTPDRTKPVNLPAPVTTTALPSHTDSNAGAADLSNEAAVREAYEKYWKISIEAFGVPQAELKKFFAAYTADPFLSSQVQAQKSFREHRQALRGRYESHIVDVEITKGSGESSDVAEVVDCQDASGVRLINTKTKKPVPGGRGSEAQGVRMTFALTPAGWLALKYADDKKACK